MLARDLGIGHIMVPHRPGVVSALGGLVSDLKGDFVLALFVPCAAQSVDALQAANADLIVEATAWLYGKQGFEAEGDTLISAEMRHLGQSFEVDVPLKQEWILEGNMTAIRSAFDARHQDLFDFNNPQSESEIVNLTLIVVGQSQPLHMDLHPVQTAEAGTLKHAPMWMAGEEYHVAVYARDSLLRAR